VGTVAGNVERFGTGALNIDGCRIAGEKAGGSGQPPLQYGGRNHRPFHDSAKPREFDRSLGRWPANVCLDEDAAAMLDHAAPETGASGAKDDRGRTHGFCNGRESVRDDTWGRPRDDLTGASRFFYTSKASRAERNAGLDGMPRQRVGMMQDDAYEWKGDAEHAPHKTPAAPNHHPTVKPLDLMQWLCRLVTPKGGLILDPFCGSGSTGRAAIAEGFGFIGIELSEEYAEIARARIAEYAPLFGGAA
jgi:site-specific DNA-methyltransferase (adenine-specific)